MYEYIRLSSVLSLKTLRAHFYRGMLPPLSIMGKIKAEQIKSDEVGERNENGSLKAAENDVLWPLVKRRRC